VNFKIPLITVLILALLASVPLAVSIALIKHNLGHTGEYTSKGGNISCDTSPLTEEEKRRAVEIALSDPLIKSISGKVNVSKVMCCLWVQNRSGCKLGADVGVVFDKILWVELTYSDRFFLKDNVTIKGLINFITVTVDINKNMVISYRTRGVKMSVLDVINLDMPREIRDIIGKAAELALDHINTRYSHRIGRNVSEKELHTEGILILKNKKTCAIWFEVVIPKGDVEDKGPFKVRKIDIIIVTIDPCADLKIIKSDYIADVEEVVELRVKGG
jgi:hypothetical protein